MAFAVGALDEAVREYLLYRGFTQSLKSFDFERKDDRDKGFSFRVSPHEEEGGATCALIRMYPFGQILHVHCYRYSDSPVLSVGHR